MKKTLTALLLIAIMVLGGCSIDLGKESIDLPTELYSSENGYDLMVPIGWQQTKNSPEQVSFVAPDADIAFSITTELGGIDYYSMREIKDQFTVKLGEELFNNYKVVEDNNGTKYFWVWLTGTDKEGKKIAVDIYAYQPFITIRHYMVVVSAEDIYSQYSDSIAEMINSFTITMTEDEYLQLMRDRREAAAAEEAAKANEEAGDVNENAEGEEEIDQAQ